eukprot:scaffold1380_cov161-Amphora_coffeaeformis.AAC.8
MGQTNVMTSRRRRRIKRGVGDAWMKWNDRGMYGFRIHRVGGAHRIDPVLQDEGHKINVACEDASLVV